MSIEILIDVVKYYVLGFVSFALISWPIMIYRAYHNLRLSKNDRLFWTLAQCQPAGAFISCVYIIKQERFRYHRLLGINGLICLFLFTFTFLGVYSAFSGKML